MKKNSFMKEIRTHYRFKKNWVENFQKINSTIGDLRVLLLVM